MKKQIPFSKLTRVQKRIAVCKDSLMQIMLGFFRVESYTVFSNPSLDGDPKADLQPILKKLAEDFKAGIARPCKVCQRGMLLASLVMLDNKFKLGDLEEGGIYSPRSSTDKRLKDVFSGDQLEFIEDVLMGTFHDDRKIEDRITKFRTRYKGNSRDVAKAILKNMIRNKGIFILPK